MDLQHIYSYLHQELSAVLPVDTRHLKLYLSIFNYLLFLVYSLFGPFISLDPHSLSADHLQHPFYCLWLYYWFLRFCHIGIWFYWLLIHWLKYFFTCFCPYHQFLDSESFCFMFCSVFPFHIWCFCIQFTNLIYFSCKVFFGWWVAGSNWMWLLSKWWILFKWLLFLFSPVACFALEDI